MDEDLQIDELEFRLRRYQVTGPSNKLRARIVGGRRSGTAWWWAMAATLALVAIELNIATRLVDAEVMKSLRQEPQASPRLQELTELLGDAAAARQLDVLIDFQESLMQESGNGLEASAVR
jgi:hypothetical protein